MRFNLVQQICNLIGEQHALPVEARDKHFKDVDDDMMAATTVMIKGMSNKSKGSNAAESSRYIEAWVKIRVSDWVSDLSAVFNLGMKLGNRETSLNLLVATSNSINIYIRLHLYF